MNITKAKTVADIVTKNIKTAHVFKKYGIDFCCGGGITIEKACAKKGLDFSVLKEELLAVDTVTSNEYNFDKMDLSFLIDHIVNVHHTYVEENIPLLIQYANKVAKVHGHHYTEVVEINNLFTEVANELSTHMRKEELILFPYIKQMVEAEKDEGYLAPPPFGTVNNPIQMMEYEHENAGNVFKEIAKLTNNYTAPEDACNTFKALYSKLEEFEQDLHLHIHLENNILHPKAIQLETKQK